MRVKFTPKLVSPKTSPSGNFRRPSARDVKGSGYRRILSVASAAKIATGGDEEDMNYPQWPRSSDFSNR